MLQPTACEHHTVVRRTKRTRKEPEKELFEIISDMIDDVDFTFIEVDLDKNSDGDVVEKEIEKEIRTGKKAPWTNLEVNIEGNLIKCDSAKLAYGKAIEEILKVVDPVQFSIDFPP